MIKIQTFDIASLMVNDLTNMKNTVPIQKEIHGQAFKNLLINHLKEDYKKQTSTDELQVMLENIAWLFFTQQITENEDPELLQKALIQLETDLSTEGTMQVADLLSLPEESKPVIQEDYPVMMTTNQNEEKTDEPNSQVTDKIESFPIEVQDLFEDVHTDIEATVKKVLSKQEFSVVKTDELTKLTEISPLVQELKADMKDFVESIDDTDFAMIKENINEFVEAFDDLPLNSLGEIPADENKKESPIARIAEGNTEETKTTETTIQSKQAIQKEEIPSLNQMLRPLSKNWQILPEEVQEVQEKVQEVQDEKFAEIDLNVEKKAEQSSESIEIVDEDELNTKFSQKVEMSGYSTKNSQIISEGNAIKNEQQTLPTISEMDWTNEVGNLVVEEISTGDLQTQDFNASFQLTPENLGEMDIRLTMKNNELTAIFTVEEEKTKEWLNMQVSQLMKQLAGKDIQMSDYQVVLTQPQEEFAHMGADSNPFSQQQERNSQQNPVQKRNNLNYQKEFETTDEIQVENKPDTQKGLSIWA